MSDKAIITVIMSVYKEPLEWLRQSIESILRQTYSNFEFIIICDNPDYNAGIALLNEYTAKDSRIRLILNEENIGLTKSLNKGLAIANGKYIARMDADDISMPNRFEKQYRFMEQNPNVDVCGMGIRMFGNLGLFSVKKKLFPQIHREILTYMMFDNPFAHPTVMFKPRIQGGKVLYDESMAKAQDYRLWYDLYQQGAQFYNINDIGLRYRISKTQISSKNNTVQKVVANEIRAQMVKDCFVMADDNLTMLHNEICNIKKTDIDISMKKEWMKRLRNDLIKKENLPDSIDKLLFLIWIANCAVYSDKKGIFQYPSKQLKLYCNALFLNNLLKTCLGLNQ